MAGRIRSIKPEILEDEKTAALSHLAWRLFVSLWLLADDYGNLRGDPVYVLGQALWATRETRDTIAAALDELAGVGLLLRYAVRGQSYYHIAGWAKHQKVAHPGKPRMPGPEEADNSSSREVESLAKSSGDSRETLKPDLRPPTSDLRPSTEDPPSRAIPPSPGPTPAPRAVAQPAPPVVPAVSQPATAREDIARTQRATAPDPKLDRIVQARVGLDPPHAGPRAHASRDRDVRPSNMPHSEPTLDQLWAELELARGRAAAARGVAIRPLVAHDSGRAELAAALVEAARIGKRAALVADVRHVIAAAEAEARVAPEPGKRDQLQWFTGAVFSPNNFRRLAAAPLPKPKIRREQQASAVRVADPPLSAEDRAAMEELRARLAAGNNAAAVDLLAGQRAPPASAAPTSTDQHSQPAKDTAT